MPNRIGFSVRDLWLAQPGTSCNPMNSEFQVNTVVSGALDRLHYEKDPCVKYDIGRKLWIYLHRDRSEEEFGKPGLVLLLGSVSSELRMSKSHVVFHLPCS